MKKNKRKKPERKEKIEIIKKVYREFTFLLEERELKKIEEELNNNN